MEPLFKTTVHELVETTERRITELKTLRDEKRAQTFKQAQGCDSYEKLRTIMDAHREYDFDSKMSQYTDNLEYLKACDSNITVSLSQTEWRHYFHGTQRPELC